MSAARHLVDCCAEAERLVDAAKALHEAVAAGRALSMTDTAALLAKAGAVRFHAHRSHAALAMFPDRRLPHSQTVTLGEPEAEEVMRVALAIAPGISQEAREFLQQHPEATR